MPIPSNTSSVDKGAVNTQSFTNKAHRHLLMKKILAPVTIVSLLLCIVCYNVCSGSSNEIVLGYEPYTDTTAVAEDIELKVYVENSGSMNAYMCPGSTLKDAVFDYISSIKSAVKCCELYYINSKLIPHPGDLENFIKNLTPASFAKAGGNNANTDLREIFKTILANQNVNTVSVFVSDCILDISKDTKDFFGNCQISVKNTFSEAINKNPNLAVEIAKMDSKFEGYWYCGQKSQKLSDVRRPYYIWVIGEQALLAKLNKRCSLLNSEYGFREYCAYSNISTCPFEIVKKRYNVYGRGGIGVEVLANLDKTLQPEQVLTNAEYYSLINVGQSSITSVRPITNKSSPYTHVIKLLLSNPQTLQSEEIRMSFPTLPAWVETSHDETGDSIESNLDRTTGLKYLISGVAKAYDERADQGIIHFTIKNIK